MDNKAADKNNNEQKKSRLRELLSHSISPEDSSKLMVYYGGCMGAIVFITFLIRFLVGIFK